MKLFYRAEFYFQAQWYGLDWHDTLDRAREHLATSIMVDEAIRKEKPWTPKTKYRIIDHLGAVHWPEERKVA
mgnify:CR=1 FL=1